MCITPYREASEGVITLTLPGATSPLGCSCTTCFDRRRSNSCSSVDGDRTSDKGMQAAVLNHGSTPRLGGCVKQDSAGFKDKAGQNESGASAGSRVQPLKPSVSGGESTAKISNPSMFFGEVT